MSAQEQAGESGESREVETRKLSPRSGDSSARLNIPASHVDKLGGIGTVALVPQDDGTVLIVPLAEFIDI